MFTRDIIFCMSKKQKDKMAKALFVDVFHA